MKKKIFYGHQWIDEDDINSVVEVLKGDFLTTGPYVSKFEEKLCEYTGASYCVVCSSGTAALHLANLALGLKEGDEGITSVNTFVASANSMVYSGATPVLCDIDGETGNIDVSMVESLINERSKVIIPVHFAGNPVDMEEVSRIARRHGLAVIEDACHALGAVYKTGEKVGSCVYSDITVFSFHPVKHITTGEGGAVLTNSRELYEKVKMLRTHGIVKDSSTTKHGMWYYEMRALGFNYRITDFQCALGMSQLKKIDSFVARRREIAEIYDRAFADSEIISPLGQDSWGSSAYHLYVIRVNFKKAGMSRNTFMERLKQKGIFTQVHYIPVNFHPFYQQKFGYKTGDFPQALKYYEEALSIPMYPKMSDEDVNFVIESIFEVLNY